MKKELILDLFKSFGTYFGIGAGSSVLGFAILMRSQIGQSKGLTETVILVLAVPIIVGFIPLAINAGVLTYLKHKDELNG